MIEISEARAEADRRAAYALRFAVYVEEMGRHQTHANHALRQVEEPEDENARLLVARTDRGEVVGTARVHLKSEIPSTMASMYQLDHFIPFHPTQTSTTTKLMVAPAYRRSPLALRLAQACYDLGLAEGVCFNFIDCNAPLRPFFARLGFRQVFEDFVHPDYGTVSPLVLALHDVAYMRRIGSPFALPDLTGDHPSVEFFARLLDQSSHPMART